ncbi:MAG TPA: PDZ domain-containing protein [Acidimicrobiales bacterium]|nr:PDZ domain-containing protein [Acidimicrobiales bacterium]
MERGSPFTGGDVPEDPDSTGDEAGAPQRGWVSPEDRLWRHPSEVSNLGLPPSVPSLFGSGADRWHRRRAQRASLAAGVVGVAALATTLAVVLSLVDTKGATSKADVVTGSNSVPASATSLTSMPLVGHDVMRMVASVRPSLVALEPLDASGPTHMTGVVLPGGELVVTAASAVAGAKEIDVVTATGKRLLGQVKGSDARSGVAVISTGGGLTPATFADEVVQPDDLDIVACLCDGPQSPSSPSSHAAAAVGMVEEVGAGVTLDGGPDLVNTIEAEMPLGPTSWGGVLLDSRGRVIGILDGEMSAGADTIGVFVPAPLAEGVALELANAHGVDHGWLGVVCTDQSEPGAEVTSIMSGSPASKAGLRPGDLVVAVGTHPVTSVADLQERLYTVAPGTTVQLAVERGTGTAVVPVKLADSPQG